jgi:predicted DNA binding CopG/RHH family protein
MTKIVRKKLSTSSITAARKRRLAELAARRDSAPYTKIDFFDIPQATDAELRRARRVGRPATGNAKQLIAIRIAPLLSQLRRMAAKQSKPYQTLIHDLLEKAARKVA